MSCVFAHVSNIISSWQRWGSAGHESWHVSVQSSPPRNLTESRVSCRHHDRLEEDSVGSSDITLHRDTFAYFVHFLRVFWRRSFSRGHVTGRHKKSLRDMILLVTVILTITMAGPQQLRSHHQVPGVGPLPLPPCATFIYLVRRHSEEERDNT